MLANWWYSVVYGASSLLFVLTGVPWCCLDSCHGFQELMKILGTKRSLKSNKGNCVVVLLMYFVFTFFPLFVVTFLFPLFSCAFSSCVSYLIVNVLMSWLFFIAFSAKLFQPKQKWKSKLWMKYYFTYESTEQFKINQKHNNTLN